MTESLHPLLVRRGITDFEAGVERAEDHFWGFLHDAMPLVRVSETEQGMGLLSMVTRAQAFHSGTINMLRANDPYSAYALVRSYAENAAALLWAEKHPERAGGLSFLAGKSEKLVVGRIVDEASKHLPGFKGLYQRLSEYTHPVAGGFSSAWHPMTDKDGHVQWRSAPSFKSDDGRLWPLLWLMELTDVHRQIWPKLYRPV